MQGSWPSPELEPSRPSVVSLHRITDLDWTVFVVRLEELNSAQVAGGVFGTFLNMHVSLMHGAAEIPPAAAAEGFAVLPFQTGPWDTACPGGVSAA